MAAAEFLLIDNSNSFTKFALSSRAKLGPTRTARTRDLDTTGCRRILRGWNFEAVVLSTVVPTIGRRLARAVKPARLLQIDANTRLGVGIDYPRPATIGADRLANTVSATHFFGAPIVVVDFGTAVTFDIVDRARNYVGGVIAPGLEAMTDYLHQRTALLPKITLLEPPSAIGKSTRQAMLAGAVHGYRGLIRQILIEIRRELGVRKLPVVATGGYAGLIAAKLPEINAVRPRLTLEGLRLIANLNF